MLTIAAFALLGWMMGLGLLYWVGVLVVAALLVYEHSLVSPGDLSRLDVAFFNVNGYIAVILFVAVLGGRLSVTETLDGAEKARFVSAMFSRIARRYDLMNGLMTLGMHHAGGGWPRARPSPRPTAPRSTSPPAPATSRSSWPSPSRIARSSGPTSRSACSRWRARSCAGSARPAGSASLAADALALPFADRTFACVTSAFLLRNLADLEQGLREMQRVTRPGRPRRRARDHPVRAPGFTPLFRFYFHHVVPRIGQLVGGDREAYSYLPQSVDRFVTPGELVALMEKVGLRGVTYRRLGLGTVTIHTGIA